MLFQGFSEPQQPLKSRFRSGRVTKIKVWQVSENHWFRIDFSSKLSSFFMWFLHWFSYFLASICWLIFDNIFYRILGPKRAPKWDQQVIKKVEKCGTGPKGVTLNLQGFRFGTTQVHLGVNLARWWCRFGVLASLGSLKAPFGRQFGPLVMPFWRFGATWVAQDTIWASIWAAGSTIMAPEALQRLLLGATLSLKMIFAMYFNQFVDKAPNSITSPEISTRIQ